MVGSSNNTGAGRTRISNCVFIGDLYYGSLVSPLTAAEKNCSGIVGRYSGSADCAVINCFAKFENHNSNHSVLGEIVLYETIYEDTFWSEDVGLPADNWEFVIEDGKAVAPYVTLIFLGDWD